MSSAAVPQRILHAAGRPVRFAVAAGAHSLAVLEQQPQTNGDLRRSLGTSPAVGAVLPCSASCSSAPQLISHQADGHSLPNAHVGWTLRTAHLSDSSR